MVEEVSFMQLPLAGELKSEGVLAVSQTGDDGEPDTFGVTVETLARAIKAEPGEIELSQAKGNLLKMQSDGLAVLASQHIIPKVYSTTFSTSKSALTKQSLPDGAIVYRGTLSIKNPMGIASLGGVGIFTSLSPQSGYFYLGKQNEYVTLQIHASPKTTTASTITVNLALICSAEPMRAFDVYTGAEAESVVDGDVGISVSIRMVAGTTMLQNGFA
ncbi:hypothetical protein N4G41_15015 [Kosakonia sacchari]|uniref:hypothetical protein n=1 Tax=Kosakonia sacchari TaxID=1158459 RepID=UPI002ACE8C44|nr:hypothetical protein [Kosakonia sacchari]MDZ7322943.1 hypothetical protein [Kosakonia sacchari]